MAASAAQLSAWSLGGRRLQAAGIIVCSIVASVLYGVIHDQFTARISIEYFTVGHPRLFVHDSPTIHALAWGVLGTWWVGAGLGGALALCARAGRLPRLGIRNVVPLIVGVAAVSAVAALAGGCLAWLLSQRGVVQLDLYWAERVSGDQRTGFLVNAWSHTASYAVGGIAGIAACVRAVRVRIFQSRMAA